MDIIALIAWVVTALGGFVLLGTWLANRGKPGSEDSRVGPGLIFSHFLLAAGGLILWIVYVLSDGTEALGWLAVAVLLLVAALGFTMFFRWLSDRRRPHPPATPEQRFPIAVVGAHGLLGAVTLVLVALVAMGVGQS